MGSAAGAVLAVLSIPGVACPRGLRAGDGDPLRLTVNPRTGADHEESVLLRTIGFALARAARSGTARIEIGLEPGTYGFEERGGEGGEEFPLVVPAGIEALVVSGVIAAGGGQASGPVIAAPDACEVLLRWEAGGGPPGGRSLDLRGISFDSGLAAVSAALSDHQALSVTATDCSFREQRAAGLEITVGRGGSAAVALERCTFDGPGSGVSLEALESSRLAVRVEGCTFRLARASATSGFLSAGVEIHADPLSEVDARVLRNIFVDVWSAVQLTAAEDVARPSSARLRLDVLGNLVHGGGAAGGRVEHGVYLSLWPHHEIDVEISSNTFHALAGNVIFEDNLDRLRAMGGVIPWTFANNIASAIGGASEFAAEHGEDGPASVFPGTSRVVRKNLLSRSSLGAAELHGNFFADPSYADAASGDFRLAEASPALNRGDNAYARSLDLDLDENCRRAARGCTSTSEIIVDLGAYEAPGTCEDLAVFQRGDCDQAGGLNLTDSLALFLHLFLGGAVPPCFDACDSNDSGDLNLTDGILTLSYLFLGGPSLAMPYPAPGTDPTCDALAACKSPSM
jgi:hypothetical protein